MKKTELKPCPFCGESARLRVNERAQYGFRNWAECSNDDCLVEVVAWGDGESEAASIWNKRAHDEKP